MHLFLWTQSLFYGFFFHFIVKVGIDYIERKKYGIDSSESGVLLTRKKNLIKKFFSQNTSRHVTSQLS
jgi:hypothetical protein